MLKNQINILCIFVNFREEVVSKKQKPEENDDNGSKETLIPSSQIQWSRRDIF